MCQAGGPVQPDPAFMLGAAGGHAGRAKACPAAAPAASTVRPDSEDAGHSAGRRSCIRQDSSYIMSKRSLSHELDGHGGRGGPARARAAAPTVRRRP
jgi:hypothetical protein